MRSIVFAVIGAAMFACGCYVSAWTWSSDAGTHELSLPPQAAPTPEPTPLGRY